jgi:hypothetical protein
MMIRRAATALTAQSHLRTGAAVASRTGTSTRMLPAAWHLRPVYDDSTSLHMQKAWMSTSTSSSVVSVPRPPTSNHPHHKLEGAEGMIIYTETDEAPALATYSLYPVIAKVRIYI